MSNKREQANLYLFCGLPCSGKTTFAESLAERKEGCSVVMDFPCHTKLERDRLRQIAISTGARVQLYYLQANLETITERIQKRNTELKSGDYFIPDWLLTKIVQKFEPPDDSENPIEIELKW